MTISALGATAVYFGLGSTGPFSLQDDGGNPILFETNSEIIVQTTNATGEYDPAALTLTITTDYLLTGAGLPTPGAVTLTAPLPLGAMIIIRRRTPITQNFDLIFGGDLNLENLEEALDKLTRLIQEQNEKTDRALMFSATETALIGSLSQIVPAPLAGRILGWGAGGQLENVLSTGAQGPQGDPGPQGVRGRASVGLRGETGDDGEGGPPGRRGASGRRGRSGYPSSPGIDGEDGPPGMRGRRGLTGLSGLRGFRGFPGISGSDGEDGAGNVFSTRRATSDLVIATGSTNPRSLANRFRDVVSIKDFGAVGNGTADDAPAINAAITAAAASGISGVYVPSGTYRVINPVLMRENITLFGDGPNSIIIQGSAANLAQVIDFSTNTATGATIRNLTVDGNRANNTGRLTSGVDATRIVYYGNTNFVTIYRCTIQNGPGYGVHGSSQVGLKVTNNRFLNTEAHNFFLVYTPGNFDADAIVINNYFDGPILLLGVNNFLVLDNIFAATLVGPSSAAMTVNIAATAVTWVSGPTFATVRSGQILIANGGAIQCEIKQVNSSTSLTLATTGGSPGNIAATIGENDLLGLGGVQRCVVSGNVMRNGASFGLSLYGTPATKIEDVICCNNIMYFQGKQGFALLGAGGGAGGIGAQNIIIDGNQVINCQQSGAAGNPAVGSARNSYTFQETPQTGILVTNNYAQDNTGLTINWMSVSGLAAGSVLIGPGNHQVGATSPGIFGAVSSVVLAAAWGATAAVSNIVSWGSSVMLTITANGAGIAANPQVTVNTVAAKPVQGNSSGQNPMYSAKYVAGSGAIAPLFNENYSDTTQITFRYGGTPVAGLTYQVQIN